VANVAVAADDRDAVGCPGTEEGDFRHTRVSIVLDRRLPDCAVPTTAEGVPRA
jgi:hypothetical protein